MILAHKIALDPNNKQRSYFARASGTARLADNCSCCGLVRAELDLSQRVFRCEHCGFVADRDWNAAKNLERLAASSAVSACGEERSGAVRKSRVKRASKKQEPNSKDELCVV